MPGPGILKACCCDNTKIRNVSVEMYFLRTMCRGGFRMRYRGLRIDQAVQRISVFTADVGQVSTFYWECHPN